MEPIDDDELQALLRLWTAPEAPQRLRPPLRQSRWYAALWRVSVRIPVPVLALALLAIIAFEVLTQRDRISFRSGVPREVRLADFTPVPEAKLMIVRRTRHENR